MENKENAPRRACQSLICSPHSTARHGKTITQGIETMTLRGEVVLQVTSKGLSSSKDAMLAPTVAQAEG